MPRSGTLSPNRAVFETGRQGCLSELKVVFVSRKWPPAVGGMEIYSARLCEALDAHISLTPIVLPGRTDGSPPGPLSLLAFGIRAFLAIAIRHRGTDVVHIADMASWPVAIAAIFTRRSPAVVLSAHGTDVTFPRRGTQMGRLYAHYLKLGARLLKKAVVIANSRGTEAEARFHGFTKTCVVPLATDFSRREPEREPARLLFSGRIIPLKGLSWFVSQVLDRLPEEMELDVAGTIWDRNEAECLAHPRVRHLGGMDQSELAQAFADALAVVVPNVEVPSGQFEGFGLVAVEAAAAGGVVLASNHGGLKDAVRDKETGFILDAGNADAWIDKICEVRGWSKEERNAFTEKASKATAALFRWDRVASDTLKAYEWALRRERKAPRFGNRQKRAQGRKRKCP